MLTIRHETIYRYSQPQAHTIQLLRLSPRAEAHQRVLSWHISAPGHLHAFKDGFGNLCHMLSIAEPHDEVEIVVEGIVDARALERGRLPDSTLLSPLLFTIPTHLTQPSPAIVEFARAALPQSPCGDDFLALARAIEANVVYEVGATAVTSSAADALRLGRGVCQDHAHLFLACCHVHHIPARYVSGYIDAGAAEHTVSHAWVDVWVTENGRSEWTSIDVTHTKFPDEGYCRLAVGRDYDSAGPVRGVRRGGGTESLSVAVSVSPYHMHDQ